MHYCDPTHYLASSSFLRTQHLKRMMRMLYLEVGGIEPHGKRTMPEGEKLRFQNAVLQALLRRKRRAFRSPLALRVRLKTSDKNPSHPHTIVKNLLDLLAQPLPSLPTRRKALVYHDDSQIGALSVICHHGQAAPSIEMLVRPLRDLLDPLAEAWSSGCEDDDHDDDRWDRSRRLEDNFDWVDDLQENEPQWRQRFGNKEYESLLDIARQRLQDSFLGRSGLTPSDIRMLFNLNGFGGDHDDFPAWDEVYSSSLLRIRLTELPQNEGQSTAWKREIKTKLEEFRKKWRKLLDPLLVPVALEVIIRPPPPSRQKNIHDLDNVLRNYLLPRVAEALKPPSDYAFTLGDIGKDLPPLSTRVGFSRYEAWRLPPAPDGSSGFVSLAIVTDLTGHDSVLNKIENTIDKWVASLD
jgi:hypothetical protein